MAATNLPADLPENWQQGQIVSPNGTDVGLTEQHGYNYMAKQINDTQEAMNTHTADTTNPHEVTAEQTGAYRYYGELEDIGIARGDETINSICSTLSANSILSTEIITSNNLAIYPYTDGVLIIMKTWNSRCILYFVARTINKIWFGSWNNNISNVFSGWIELANAANFLPLDGSMAMTGELSLNNLASISQYGNTLSLRSGSVNEENGSALFLDKSSEAIALLGRIKNNNITYYQIFGEHNPQLLATTIQSLIQGGSISMIKSVQRGIITIAASATEGTATLAQAVNMSKAIVLFGGSIIGGGYSLSDSSDWDARLVLSANNKVNAARARSASYTAIVPYQVLEFA